MKDVRLMDRVDTMIGQRRLLDHPFYQAWSKGQLTREDLRRYGTQYYHWVAAFPTFLSATHANCPSLSARQEILENLVDEERGADSHPELWLRFCDALGLARDEVLDAGLEPPTRQAITAYRRICRDEPPAAALAALYAYESQQPEVMKVKREGLATLYGVTRGHDYFVAHEHLDVGHSAAERRLVERLAGPGSEDAIGAAVREGLDATWRLLDGVTPA